MSDLITAEEAQKLLDGLEIDLSGVNAGAPFLEALRDYARTVIALHAQLADAKAAQAEGMERAAGEWRNVRVEGGLAVAAIMAYSERIRALADADGLAMVQELRAERDALRYELDVTNRLWKAEGEASLELQAQRDRLAAEKAELEARVEKLVGAVIWCSGSNDFHEGGVAREGWLKLCAPLIHPAATPTPSDTDGPIWHERLGWDGNKEGEG